MENNFLTWDAFIYFFLFRGVTTTKTLKGYSFIKWNCRCFNQKNYHNLDQMCWFERNNWKNVTRWSPKPVIHGAVTPEKLAENTGVSLGLFHPTYHWWRGARKCFPSSVSRQQPPASTPKMVLVGVFIPIRKSTLEKTGCFFCFQVFVYNV